MTCVTHVTRVTYVTPAPADHAAIAKDFPGARIIASTLDGFVDEILSDAAVVAALPIVSDEIGDSWLWGCASDPKKLAKYRAAQRQLGYVCGPRNITSCLGSSAAMANFTRLLLKAPGSRRYLFAS